VENLSALETEVGNTTLGIDNPSSHEISFFGKSEYMA